MDLLALPIDIKQHICSLSESTWMWFVVNDLEFRSFAYANWRLFVKLFTHHIIKDHHEEWRLFGKLHSIYDAPAMINEDGSMTWFMNDKLHRYGDLPAHIDAEGITRWFLYDNIYREIDEDETKFWFNLDLKLHRDDTDVFGNVLPAVIYKHGTMLWFNNGVLYRDGNLPNAIYNANDSCSYCGDSIRFDRCYPKGGDSIMYDDPYILY